jgi:putative glutamine amidotransferase
MKQKVYVENSEEPIIDMFVDWGYEVVSDYKDAHLIVLGGGTDVNPMFYGEVIEQFTDQPDHKRDAFCAMLYNHARAKDKPIVGICRGAQFITAMQGGRLIQHITDHQDYMHRVMFDKTLAEDETEPQSGVMEVTSSHHQVMIPGPDVAVLARSDEGYAEITLFGRSDSFQVDELAVQGHPEWVDKDHEFQQWFMKFIGRWVT